MTITDTNLPVLISAAAFLVMALLSIGLYQFFRLYAAKRELMGKIRQDNDMRSVENESLKAAGITEPFTFRFLSLLGKQVAPEKTADYSHMRIKFLRAGIRQINALSIFWGTRFFLAMVFSLIFFMGRLTLFKVIEPSFTMALATFFALLGFYLPEIWLRLRIAGRRNRILEALPDALDLLVVCVEAGMGLDAAINRVAQEIRLSSPELSDELKFFNLEVNAGKTRQDALKNLALRTNLEDVNSLVTLLIQTEKFGTSVAHTLRVYSDSFRTKRFQKAEEIAAKLPVKLVFPLIMFIFPALFVVLVGPAAIRIYQSLMQH